MRRDLKQSNNHATVFMRCMRLVAHTSTNSKASTKRRAPSFGGEECEHTTAGMAKGKVACIGHRDDVLELRLKKRRRRVVCWCARYVNCK